MRDTVSQSLLVYDGQTKAFRLLARWLAGQSSSLTLVPWSAAGTRKFLTEQFGDHLFAFVLVDIERNVVHAGSETVGSLLRNRGVPRPIVMSAKRAYLTAADPVGQVIHGRRPADIDGSYRLTEEARPHAEALQRDYSPGTSGDSSENDV